LLEDARSEMDVEKRKNLYIEATKIINEDVPLIPMYYSNTTVGVSNNLVGVEATSYPLFYKYSFKD
ncbi:MAG: DNA-binding protein, partial [Cetobacterium sp.]